MPLILALFFFFFQVTLKASEINRSYCENDQVFGLKVIPSVQVTDVKKSEGNIIYEATYSTDSWGRRQTTQNPGASLFALFFGCSFTWGIGVNDDETMSSYFAKLNPRYHVYNYGIPGTGPHHLLALLQNRELRGEVSEAQGVGFFYYNPGHISRVVGSARDIDWLKHGPYYYLDSHHQLQRNKNFIEGRSWTTLFYGLLKKSKLLDFFNLDFPKLNETHGQLTCEILLESKTRFHHSFPQSQFVVVIPAQKLEVPAPDIRECLSRQGMKVFYLEEAQLFGPQQTIAGDGHLNAKGNEMMARLISKKWEEEK